MADDNQCFVAADAASAAAAAGQPAISLDARDLGPAHCAPCRSTRHAQHLFTSAQLQLPAHASHDQREQAWHAVAASLGAARDRLLRVRQVHGRTVRVVRAGDAPPDPAALPDGDAIVSNLTGAVLAVVVADCVPLMLVDRERVPRLPFTPVGAAPVRPWRRRRSRRCARHGARDRRTSWPPSGRASASRTTRSASRSSGHSRWRGMARRSIAGSRDVAASCGSICGARTSTSWRRPA